MAESVSGVELRDIASGKLARTVELGGAYDILTRGGELPLNSASRRPCRAIVVPSGVMTIVGLDGDEVDLIDMGGAWQWNVQAVAVVSSDEPYTVLY